MNRVGVRTQNVINLYETTRHNILSVSVELDNLVLTQNEKLQKNHNFEMVLHTNVTFTQKPMSI